MQFKRGGWRYSKVDGVVTMPGNARQAFPAKRDGDGGAERREADRGGLEMGVAGKGGEGEGRGTETIVQYGTFR